MQGFLKPDFRFRKVTDIHIGIFKELGVKAVFLDVDNTLCSYRSKQPLEGAIEWVRAIENEGYKVYIISNNFKKRVSAVAKKYNLDYVSFALKPSPIGFNKAAKLLSLDKRDCVIIGDQIFTDILGARFAKMKSILVEPVEVEDHFTFKIRRRLELNIKSKVNFYGE